MLRVAREGIWPEALKMGRLWPRIPTLTILSRFISHPPVWSIELVASAVEEGNGTQQLSWVTLPGSIKDGLGLAALYDVATVNTLTPETSPVLGRSYRKAPAEHFPILGEGARCGVPA